MLKKQGGTIKDPWIDTYIMPRVQIKPVACLALLIPDFKRQDFFGGPITNKKPSTCVLEKEFDVINIQQNQQQQQ